MPSTKKKKCYDSRYKSEAKDTAWENYFNKPTDETRNVIVQLYYPWVEIIARVMIKRNIGRVDTDDLISEGVVGLIKAIENFSPKRNNTFSTYAEFKIRGAMQDYLRSIDIVPRLTRKRHTKMNKVVNVLLCVLGRMPDDDDIIEYLGITPHEYKLMSSDCVLPRKYSLAFQNNEYDFKRDYTDHSAPCPYKQLAHKENKEKITECLTRYEKLIFVLYYYDGMTMREIGKAIGVCESRISQMHSNILSFIKSSGYLMDLVLDKE